MRVLPICQGFEPRNAVFWGRIERFFLSILPFFGFLIVNSLCLKKEGEVISVTYSKKKIATANTACTTVTENAKQAIVAVWKTRSERDPPSAILLTKKNTKKGSKRRNENHNQKSRNIRDFFFSVRR